MYGESNSLGVNEFLCAFFYVQFFLCAIFCDRAA